MTYETSLAIGGIYLAVLALLMFVPTVARFAPLLAAQVVDPPVAETHPALRADDRHVPRLPLPHRPRPHGLRPLAVIDPESAEQVERLAALLRLNGGGARYAHMSAKGAREDFDALRAALRGLVAPPKPQVYSHIVVSRSDQKIKESLCGKVWRPEPDVEVVGQCPNCRDQAEVWIP